MKDVVKNLGYALAKSKKEIEHRIQYAGKLSESWKNSEKGSGYMEITEKLKEIEANLQTMIDDLTPLC